MVVYTSSQRGVVLVWATSNKSHRLGNIKIHTKSSPQSSHLGRPAGDFSCRWPSLWCSFLGSLFEDAAPLSCTHPETCTHGNNTSSHTRDTAFTHISFVFIYLPKDSVSFGKYIYIHRRNRSLQANAILRYWTRLGTWRSRSFLSINLIRIASHIVYFKAYVYYDDFQTLP